MKSSHPEAPGADEIAALRAAATARRALDHASDYAPAVVEALDKTSLLLRRGRTEEANELLSFALDAINVLLFTSEAVKVHLPAEETAVLGNLPEELCPWLGQTEEASRAGDWLRVADYLEFEVKPLISQWSERAAAPAGAGAAKGATS